VDSDFVADLDKRRFLTGYVFTAGGCVVSWKATLQLVHLLLVPTWIREGSSQVMAIVEVCKESVCLALWRCLLHYFFGTVKVPYTLLKIKCCMRERSTLILSTDTSETYL
jgi:hypothetical protein